MFLQTGFYGLRGRKKVGKILDAINPNLPSNRIAVPRLAGVRNLKTPDG
jgi:hypothetical protein